MCGICGMFDLRPKGAAIDREAVLEKMLGAIRHRGPDGSQTLLLDRAALGFNRLSFLVRYFVPL